MHDMVSRKVSQSRVSEGTSSALVLLLTLAIATIDMMTPAGIQMGALYILPLLLSGMTRRSWIPLLVASLALISLWVTYLLRASGPLVGLAATQLFDRAVLTVTIAGTCWLVVIYLRRTRSLAASEAALAEACNKLESSQGLAHLAGEVGLIGGWSVRLADKQVTLSDMVTRVLGLESDTALLTEDWSSQVCLPAYRDVMREAFEACARMGTGYDLELQMYRADRQSRWVRAIGRARRDGSGRIVEVQGAFQDIQARKEAEASLAHSRRQFELLADSMPFIVWTCSEDGDVDFVNAQLVTYSGKEREALLGRTSWLRLLHPDDRAGALAAWRLGPDAGSTYTTEFRLRRHDGVYRWHLNRARSERDEAGAIVHWYGTSVDIDDHKRLTLEAQRAARRLTTTLQSITDAFFLLDRDWRFTFLNPEAERLIQRPAAELLGKVIWEEFPAAVGSTFETQYRKAVADSEAVAFEGLYAPLNLWVEVRAYPSEEGLAVYFNDLSSRRALEERVRRSQRMESLGQLTGGIAHDFNNLLTVILGNSELLVEILQEPTPRALAEMIVAAGQRASDLTRRLLAFARRQALAPRSVDLNELVGNIDRLLRHTLGEHIEIQRKHTEGLWTTQVDPAQLETALLNLALNARDAMPKGGRLTLETANVTLDSAYAEQHVEVDPGEYVLLEVSDTGEGITPGNLKRMFEPFFTTRPRGQGTGLGLPMVYGFVKQTGGHITIHSEVGQGTTVRIYLPREREAAAAESQIVSAPHVGGAGTILLVEDDELVRRYAHDLLLTLGYRVVVAANGPEALTLIQERDDIELLFTDIVMPGGMSGRELADRALALRPDLKVLYTSGYTEDAIVHHGRLDPGVLLLSKPYRRVELARKIEEALRVSRN